MKKIFLMLTALLVLNSVSAQNCLSEGITFSTQAQINSFQTNYPNCTQIEGDVTINGYNITNLNGLNVLTSIGGNLNIECNEILVSMGGLNHITSIGGDLYFIGNLALTSLAGLDNLVDIGGDLLITNNIVLNNLSGLSALTSIGGMLWIDNNNLLNSLAGLNNIVNIGGNLRICANPILTDLQGLSGLTSIGGSLIIGGLGHLGGIGNPSLASLSGLYNLNAVAGDINIGYNTSLTSLAGLDNIEAGSIQGLSVYNNETLSACEVESICNYLAMPGITADICDNATGCNSQEEVNAACTLLSGENVAGGYAISIYPSPAFNRITLEISAKPVNCHLSILNFRGQELISQTIKDCRTVIDIVNLPQGLYFVRLTNERLVGLGKFTKLQQ